VLNADDEWCAAMADRVRGRVIYFSLAPDNPVVERHYRAHGRALLLRPDDRGGMICLADRRETSILHASEIPATFEGRARVNIANAMAAAAACIGLEVDLQCIRQGLRSFTTSYQQTPGRLNLIETDGARTLIDYCHNAHGLTALADFVRQLAATRTVAMIAMPGDRRDEDIRAFGAIAARTFDEVIIREDSDTRDRARGEVAAILQGALLDAGLAPERVTIETDEARAMRLTLDRARPGELAVLLVDDPALAWQEVTAYSRDGARAQVTG
jgi:cyanophycin synthetase